MGKRILVLNIGLSGINKYLFSQLQIRGWSLTIIDVPFPRWCRWWALISTFRLGMKRWKKKFNEKLSNLYKSPEIFLQRTNYCHKKISKLHGQFDVIFQISGMFAPAKNYDCLKTPFVTFNDYTMALAGKYADWAPLPAQTSRWKNLEKELQGHAAFIFATSENTRQSFINDYGLESDKVVNVGYGLTLDNLPTTSRTYDNRTILYIGLDFKRKGGYILLEAFRKVKEVIKEAELIIVGPNQDMLPIDQPGVKSLGCIEDRSVIESLYEKASIFVMPSLCEPFGLVFLEAMAYSLPCIGSDIDAIPEIIEDGKTGFLVPPSDVEARAEKIIALLGEVELRAKMGQAGRKRLEQKFCWDNIGEKIDTCLQQAIEKNI